MKNYKNKTNSWYADNSIYFSNYGKYKKVGFVEGYKLSHETYKRYLFCVFGQELTELLFRLYKEKTLLKNRY